MKRDCLLTLQLRPHIAAMLDTYVGQVRARMPAHLQAKVTRSLIVRKLLMRGPPLDAFRYADTGRHRDKAEVQLRVRCSTDEWKRVQDMSREREVPMARFVAATIVDALYPDGNYPANPDTKQPQPTKAPDA